MRKPKKTQHKNDPLSQNPTAISAFESRFRIDIHKDRNSVGGSASLLLPKLYVLIGPFSQTSPSDAALVQTLDPMRFTQEIGTISAADLSGTAIANDIFLPPHVSQHTR